MARNEDRPMRDRPPRDRDRPDRNRPGRGRYPFIQAAQRMARVFNQPLMRELSRQEARARDTSEEMLASGQNLYDAAVSELGALQTPYAAGMEQLQQGFTEDVGGLRSLLGSSGTQAEIGASEGVLGSLGAAGLQQMTDAQARNLGYGTSANRQAVMERTTFGRNTLEDLADALAEIEAERRGIAQDTSLQAKDIAWQLRQDRFDRAMAMRDYLLRSRALNAQIGNDRALLDLTARQIEAMLRGNRPPRDRNRPPRNNENDRNRPPRQDAHGRN